MSGSCSVIFRIAYGRYSELRADATQQMALGGLLVKVRDAAGLTLDTPVHLVLVLPDGTCLQSDSQVLQVFAGFGVAVSVGPELLELARRAASGLDASTGGPARHERIDPGRPIAWSLPSSPIRLQEPVAWPERTARPAALAPSPVDGASRAEKIQKALHGTRDERNAILRDRDRTLHPFVLKNPQLNTDDVVTIAKNVQVLPDLLLQIAERKEWFQRPAVAVALARNPKTPPDLAVRALDHVPDDALRQMAKGVGVLPHVTQAARKKIFR